MSKEIEISYPNINVDELRKKLSTIGLICKNERRLMERRKFKFKNELNGNRFGRVRNEGDKITMTVKNAVNNDLSDVDECEVEVNDFNEACEIFKALGMLELPLSAKYREEWVDKDGEVSIVIDEYKYLNPLVEIEGKNWEIVKKYSDLLGFNYDEHFDGGGAHDFYCLQYNCGRDVDFHCSDFDNQDDLTQKISWKGNVFVVAKNIAVAKMLPEMAEELYDVIDKNRDHLRLNLGWVDKTKNADDELKFINSSTNLFAILYKDKIVGTIDFHDYDEKKGEADIGYWLAKDYEGRGIVTKCCKFMLNYGFNCLGLNTIVIHMNVQNPKSEAIAKRLGMKFVGIEKPRGETIPLDCKRYEITMNEYKNG